ncbi:MAG: DNA polymerase III subunit alpha, partial [Bacillota bacterium]|nr:DNA polymerase III subunit alpha [Bacillota bacterium]
LAARAAFRDVARVLDIPYAITDKAAKEIPAHLGVTLESALRENPKLPQLLAASPELAQVYEIARALEGVPRHASTHAAGVLVTRDDVANHVPLYLNNTTQYTMNALSDLGLLKMDFLGIRTLSVIKHAIASAEKRLGASVDPDLQDDAVYELLSTGHTIGLFQLESTGFRRFIRELKPHCFEDIVDAISLYRPGPMSAIPKYLENRHRQAEIRYDHPLLRPILEATHGVLIYQEQVMRIARDLAGYDYGRSDVLRDAMGKKKYAVMQRERDVFLHGDSTYAPGCVPSSVPGCVRNGVPIEVAEKLFDDMAEFAKYAFNKSHAVGYAILAYRTAYLKTKHPIEYMAALLSTVVSMRGLLTRYTNECFRMKIPVKPPSVNFSMPDFTPEGDGIRFGFLAIKHVGRSVAQAIVESRKSGPFTSFYDFVDRIPRSELNKKAVECLIFAGAFDEFGNTRTQLIGVYDTLIDVRSASRSRDDAQISMFQSGAIETEHLYAPMPNLPEYPPDQKLELEKEVLGVYLSGHPLDAHRDLFERYATMSLSELKEIAASDNPGQVDSMRFVLPCYVRSKKEQNTKKGERMAFLVVEDFDDQIEVVLFPKVFAKYHGEDKILIRGTVQLRDEDPKLIAETIEALDPQRLQANSSVESRSRETKRSTVAGSAATNSSADSAAVDRPQILRPTLYLRFQSTEPEKLKRIEEMLRTMRTNRRPSGSPYRVIFYLADKAKQKVAYEILYLDIAQKQELEDWMGSENFREKRV